MTTDDRTYGETALLTPANMMTAFRIVIAPVFVYLIVVDRISWWTSAVGMAAAASDYFDGIVARRHGTTRSGAFLDPLADKVIVLGALYALIIARPHGLKSFIIPAILITLREIWISVYRSRAAKRGISIPASRLAKWKTFTQDWAIAFCVLPITAHHVWLGVTTIWIAVAMTLYTGWKYYADGKRATLRAG
ncbi:MAG: CDP-alcohol phosphatidyltransferase family protein [Acidimicrobiales bacterium]|jgi:CDP-diacylglycerol--glycerol-3-phosphate 3-phosphatidyltransferase